MIAEGRRVQKILSSSADKRLIVFDLDGTLAASKQAIDAEMARLLAELLAVRLVAVISGGDWAQFERQLLGHLLAGTNFANLFLLPTTGTKLYRFDGAWRPIYAENFTADERRRVLEALENAMVAAGLAHEPSWGAKIEDRGSQITFSGLGQSAPLEAKLRWDPDVGKRHKLKKLLDAWLPDFEVHIGGSTSIDITHPGIDKAYGIGKLATATGVDLNEMLFIGDALYAGGNDAPVREIGVTTLSVSDISETRSVIEAVLQNG